MSIRRREKVQGLILKARDSGEADRLLVLFTKERGLLRVLAKGVRRIPSRRGGHLEPVTEVLAVVQGGHPPYYLSGVETLNYFEELRASETAWQHARAIAAVVSCMFEEGEPYNKLFEAVAYAWRVLPKLAPEKQVLLETAVAFYALRCAGVMPQLAACNRCGTRTPTEAVVFEAQVGGWHCLLCHPSFHGTRVSLSPRLLQVLRFLAKRPKESLRLRIGGEEGRQLQETVRHYLANVTQQPALMGEL